MGPLLRVLSRLHRTLPAMGPPADLLPAHPAVHVAGSHRVWADLSRYSKSTIIQMGLEAGIYEDF